MGKVVISGTGLYIPPQSITNEELVESYNRYVSLHNEQHAEEIAAGEIDALDESSCEFIEKASGIKSRYVMEKSGILDPERMYPRLRERTNDEPSIQCEISMAAAADALSSSGVAASEVDAVIVSCSNLQRPYPAVAVEVQQELGVAGYAFDMNVACSSATFAIKLAHDAIAGGTCRNVLVVNPEITSGHINFRDRDSHFIFGDVCTAAVVQAAEIADSPERYEIVGTRLLTSFSNNIRNNFGYLNRADESGFDRADMMFVQQGRKVFKEVVPMVSQLILEHLADEEVPISSLKRLWLHQANLNMNQLIARRVLGNDSDEARWPVILDEFANTSSAGAIIAFHNYRQDLQAGDLGVICSFGAGYSAGSVIVRHCG